MDIDIDDLVQGIMLLMTLENHLGWFGPGWVPAPTPLDLLGVLSLLLDFPNVVLSLIPLLYVFLFTQNNLMAQQLYKINGHFNVPHFG